MKLYQNSSVRELSPKDFKVKSLSSGMTPKEMPCVINFYAHWCPHCNSPEMLEFWKALGEKLPKKTGIKVFALNCAHHEDVASSAGIMGFPTLKFYNKKGEISEYSGPREVKPFLQFLLKNS